MDIKNKISLINNIYSTDFTLNFNAKKHNKIKQIFENYNDGFKFKYDFTYKNKQMSGVFNDFITLSALDKDCFKINVLNIPGTPKIAHILEYFFNNLVIKVKKEKMYANKNNQIVDLFDIYQYQKIDNIILK